jgi:transcriptional regulator with XRE-family HTH domain
MERARDRGQRVAAALRGAIATELREARRAAGVSQTHVASVAGLTQSSISRVERSARRDVSIDDLAVHAAALGLRLFVKVYPDRSAVRDAAHLRLLAAFRALVHPTFQWQSEAPVVTSGDMRAWDVLLSGPVVIGVDAETRLHDIQAIQRRMELKRRDGNVDRVLLVVADTRHNRRVLDEHGIALAGSFPARPRAVLEGLSRGIDPGGDGIVLVASREPRSRHERRD